MEENKRDAECVRIDTSTERSMVGKLVVVTGASSGIGRAIAKVFYSQGACVALGARRMELLQSLCQDLDSASQFRWRGVCWDRGRESDNAQDRAQS